MKAVEDHLSFAKEENDTLQERASVADAAVSDTYTSVMTVCAASIQIKKTVVESWHFRFNTLAILSQLN